MKHDISEDMTFNELFIAVDALESVCYTLKNRQTSTFNTQYDKLWIAMNTAYKYAFQIKEELELKEFQDSSLTTKAG